jgi:hypothetical protein
MRYATLLILLLGGTAPQAADAPAGEPMASAAAERPQRVQSAAAPAQGRAESGTKTLSGMSILGNQEAPKSLVIVPWKSSRIGDEPGLSDSLDDSRGPVDKEVFMRELAYYEIRSE